MFCLFEPCTALEVEELRLILTDINHKFVSSAPEWLATGKNKSCLPSKRTNIRIGRLMINTELAKAVMRALEDSELSKIKPKIWIPYAEDTIVIIKHSDIERAQTLINNNFKGIQFIMEMNNGKKLHSLDALVRITASRTPEISVYRQTAHIEQIPSSGSNHPKVHKISFLRTLFN